MKRNYKVKDKNKTKLKSYLKNGTKTTSFRNRRCTCNKRNSLKCCDIQ